MQAVDPSQKFERVIDRQLCVVRCLTCDSEHVVTRDEDGGGAIAQGRCNHADCPVLLCWKCPQFICSFCGQRFCESHKIEIGNDCPTCPGCFKSIQEDTIAEDQGE